MYSQHLQPHPYKNEEGPLGVCLLEMLQGRQTTDGLPGFLLRDAQFVETLEVQPELGRRPEEMGKSQSGIACNSTPSVQDFGHTIGWNTELPRKFSSTHA